MKKTILLIVLVLLSNFVYAQEAIDKKFDLIDITAKIENYLNTNNELNYQNHTLNIKNYIIMLIVGVISILLLIKANIKTYLKFIIFILAQGALYFIMEVLK